MDNVIVSKTYEFVDSEGECRYTMSIDEDFCFIKYYEKCDNAWKFVEDIMIDSDFARAMAIEICNEFGL